MNVKERLKRFINSQNMTVSDFERECGMSNGYVSSISKSIGQEKLENISNRFPQLNKAWLLLGIGDMIENNIPQPTYTDVADSYTDIYECQCCASLPYVPRLLSQSRDISIADAIANNNEGIIKRTLRDIIGKVDYIQKVITNAMSPLFQPGDYLFIQFLPSSASILSGAIYLVDTSTFGAMVRQVYRVDGGYTLKSLNKDYDDVFVADEDLYSISLVVRSLRSDFNAPQDSDAWDEVLKAKNKQIDDLIDEVRRQNERMNKLIDYITRTDKG